MAAIKAVVIAAIITGALFLIVIWFVPLMTFLIVFGTIALITYAIIHENEQKGPPQQ